MAEDFYIDPAGLSRAVGDLRSSGLRLSGAFAKLDVVLKDNHNCWGTDDIGKAFRKNYVQPAGDVVSGSDAAVVNITQMSDVTDQNSTVFQSVDQESAEAIDRKPPPAA
ncbi:MAG: hypothetical protein QOE93_2329 [Actinomycetota bacterium]|jgi:hypothetical protein|nr:hypothetical protein [Actinomycetota bacterium]